MTTSPAAPDTADAQTTKLRYLILEANMTSTELSDLTGIPKPRISEYCLGRRQISPTHLIRLCRVLRRNPEDIRGYASE